MVYSWFNSTGWKYNAAIKAIDSWDMAIALVVGNFIYIGASDLIPKMNNDTTINLKSRAVTLIAFILGIYLLLLVMP